MRRVAWVLTPLVILGLLVGYLARQVELARESDRMPDWTPPVIDYPEPNAYDTFVAAAELIVDPGALGYNPYEPDWTPAKDDDPILDDPRLAKQVRYAADNAAALAKLREGLEQECQAPLKLEVPRLYPELSELRELGRMLAFQSVGELVAGDHVAAAASALDGFAFGQKMRHGDAIGLLVAMALEGIAARPLRRSVAWLEADEAAAAARRLEAIVAAWPPLRRSIQLEHAEAMAEWRHLLSEEARVEGLPASIRSPADAWDALRGPPNWRQVAYQMACDAPGRSYAGVPTPALDEAARQAARQRLLSSSLTTFLADLERRQQESLRRAETAWHQPLPELTPHPVLDWAEPEMQQVRYRCHSVLADARLLLTQLALHAWRQENGAYPPSLAQLVPEILTAVPLDPFTADQPLRYRREGDGYRLYSAGPDGDDDGGRPLPVLTGADGRPRHPTADDDGDLLPLE